jgi:glycosyltransferase involved in cell wall biosynthesis
LSFSSGSAVDLAEKTALVLKDEKGREAMGKRGREYAGKFLWDRIAVQFEDALREVV